MSHAQPSNSVCQTTLQRPGPISRMPTELLAEIFLRYAGNEPRFSPDPCYPSVLTGRVCRRWRSIVFSTPQLWTAIEVTISDDMQPAALAAASQRFGRSGACPLILRILILNEPTELGQHVLDFILTTAHRWQTVELHVTAVFAQHLLDRRPLRLPLMECLTIRMLLDILPVRIQRGHLWDLFEDSPLLWRLNIVGPGSHRWLILPWTQLTTIHIKNVSITEMFEILGKCPNLARCTYGLPVDLGQPRRPIDQIQLAQLRSLDSEPCLRLWDVCVMPALESLILRGWSQTESVSFTDLIDLLRQVKNTLLILRLHHIILRGPDLPMILHSAPNLVEFSYLPGSHMLADRHAYSPRYINDLYTAPGAKPGESPPIVPNLQRLTLGGDGEYSTTAKCDWCIGVVRARWDGVCENVTRLRYVRFCFGKDWGGERVSREVDALREEGLDIELLDAVALPELDE